MIPESQQLANEAVQDDRQAAADRIDREVEAMLAAAAKRRADARSSVDEHAASPNGELGSGTHNLAELRDRIATAEAHLAQARAERDELQALLEISESERETALAEARTSSDRAADLDRQLRELENQVRTVESASKDDAAADLLVAAARAADDVRDASRARALRTLTRARDLAALIHAETEREREALTEARKRRADVENETQEIPIQATAAAESLAAEIVAERRAEAENEAAEIVAKARAEADSLVTLIEDQRYRVRELLAGTLASLGAEDGGPHEDIMADLESRLHETTETTA